MRSERRRAHPLHSWLIARGRAAGPGSPTVPSQPDHIEDDSGSSALLCAGPRLSGARRAAALDQVRVSRAGIARSVCIDQDAVRCARKERARTQTGPERPGQTVNLVAQPSAVRIRLSPPPPLRPSLFLLARRPAPHRRRHHRGVAQRARTFLLGRSRSSERAAAAITLPRDLRAPDVSSQRGRSSMVERQPSKLHTWVRFHRPPNSMRARASDRARRVRSRKAAHASVAVSETAAQW